MYRVITLSLALALPGAPFTHTLDHCAQTGVGKPGQEVAVGLMLNLVRFLCQHNLGESSRPGPE